jgi:hypothetical protein
MLKFGVSVCRIFQPNSAHLPNAYSPKFLEWIFLETQVVGSTHVPLHCTNLQRPESLLQRHGGEEPEIELGLD